MYLDGMVATIMGILTTFGFWATFVGIVQFLILIGIIWPRIRERWLQYQSNRRREMLKCSPSLLKSKLKDAQHLIAFLEDELLHAQAKIARMDGDVKEKETEIKDLRNEVKTLIGRNNIMANEIRCDDGPGTDTQVFRPSNARRFYNMS